MAIELDRVDGVAWVRLAKPQVLNALTPDEFEHLAELITEVAGTSTDRALVIAGSGGAFCAGADLSQLNDDSHVIEVMRRIHRAARQLHELSKPALAAVDGVAAGAGANLALGCDFVLASTAASFRQIFVKRGLAPDFGGTWLLPRLVGMQTAKRLMMLGDAVDADTALRIGLVGEVLKPEDLDERVQELARRLAAGPPVALGRIKHLLAIATSNGFDDQLDAEAAAAAVNVATADFAEGLAAFAERRAPVFRGR
jgi:enoyl-CoA hydratase/carnithine racemase